MLRRWIGGEMPRKPVFDRFAVAGRHNSLPHHFSRVFAIVPKYISTRIHDQNLADGIATYAVVHGINYDAFLH